jgi:hypothetical protein
MRQRGLGNSSSAVRKQVQEQNGETYLNNLQMYLSHCRVFKRSAEGDLLLHASSLSRHHLQLLQDTAGAATTCSYTRTPLVPPPAATPGHRWCRHHLQLLQDSAGAATTCSYSRTLPPPATTPGHRWFMKVYQLDVLKRIIFASQGSDSRLLVSSPWRKTLLVQCHLSDVFQIWWYNLNSPP